MDKIKIETDGQRTNITYGGKPVKHITKAVIEMTPRTKTLTLTVDDLFDLDAEFPPEFCRIVKEKTVEIKGEGG
ncbi:MAG: hypothetical protein OEY64_03185 [Nitrospinota bacterium]|nr:hypothetical protein [Nitrospinota bacterium]